MKTRKTLVSLASATALTLAIAGSALAAPTVTGELICVRVSDGTTDSLGGFTGTRKDLAQTKKFWTSTNVYCKKGSVKLV